MTVVLDNLNLGTALDLTPVYVQEYGELSTPLSRGSMKQLLGSKATYQLHGAFVGPERFASLSQLQRALWKGETMKLDADSVQTIVWLKNVKPTFKPRLCYYTVELEDSRFKQVSACESTGGWTVDGGGGSLTLCSDPAPLEGNCALKLSGTITGGVASRLKYAPAERIDFSDESWVAFWLRTNTVAYLSSAYVKLYVNTSNYAAYDFSALIKKADEWLRIRVHKRDFNVTGTMEWDNIAYVTVDVTRSQTLEYYFLVDDLGGFE